MSKRISKSLVVNGNTLVTEAAWNAELDAKHEKLVGWLRTQELAGVLHPPPRECCLVDGRRGRVRVLRPARPVWLRCW